MEIVWLAGNIAKASLIGGNRPANFRTRSTPDPTRCGATKSVPKADFRQIAVVGRRREQEFTGLCRNWHESWPFECFGPDAVDIGTFT
ncbi:hypothetical protein BFN03_11540 [Rhodococcus sp. WMMA185]|nr:hypothetical protein BFN03_11540 [Rhodococcus sp. WMMA185]